MVRVRLIPLFVSATRCAVMVGTFLALLVVPAAAMGNLDQDTTVTLLSEHVVMEPELSATSFVSTLELRNTGPPCTVNMGLPLFVGGYYQRRVVGVRVEVDDEAVPIGAPDARFDGRVEQSKVEGEKATRLQGQVFECAWYTFSVDFAAGETRHIRARHDHRGMAGEFWSSIGGTYVVATGALWSGPVGDLQVEIRLRDRLNYSRCALRASETSGQAVPWLFGAGTQLPTTPGDASLLWACREYTGDPWAVSLTGHRCPRSITLEGTGTRRRRHHPLVQWRDGQLLVRPDFLAEVVLAQEPPIEESFGRFAVFAKEGETLYVSTWLLPDSDTWRTGHLVEYVDPTRVFELFGGGVQVSLDEDGDASVDFTSEPTRLESARATALYATQVPEYRLKSLEAVRDRWPEEFSGLCQDVLAGDPAPPAVGLWMIGHFADAPPQWALPPAVRTAMQLPEGQDLASVVAGAIVSTRHDEVFLGGGLMLAELDPLAGEARLIEGLTALSGKSGRHGGRNVGLALRVMSTEPRPSGRSASAQLARLRKALEE